MVILVQLVKPTTTRETESVQQHPSITMLFLPLMMMNLFVN
jgi:hypothetical protein